ncbi:MAG: glycosyltransferase [Deltaproteobacteria bacterium]|nr:glycosyltransferase [Deltaproteobacteria bacterium]
MKVNLLLNANNRAWIIQKIAERFRDQLPAFGAEATITESVDASADVVHHMSWAFAEQTPQPSTMFITHLDDPLKMQEARARLRRDVRLGICMSRDTMQQLIDHGCPPSSVYFIGPAHDGLARPRRIVLGLTTRLYPDGRKREALLHEIAERMDLSPFEFQIFGIGWERTAERLRAAGALVHDHGESDDYRKDYQAILEALPRFDYYLYLGLDEGSLGTLDALAAGVPTIVTPQGFHLDLPGGITHAVLTADDLQRVLTDIAAAKQTLWKAVEQLTWTTFVQRHAEVWRALLAGAPLPALPEVAVSGTETTAALDAERRRLMAANALSPRRILASISRLPAFRALRREVDKRRLKH